MITATYDEVFDAQAHYRELLDAMARPGKINKLNYVPLKPEGGLNLGSAYVAFTLLGPEINFSVMGYERSAAEYIRLNTGATESHPESADFIFATAELSQLAIRCAKPGNLLYPDTSATVVIEVPALSFDGASGGIKLTLSGPGIESENTVFVDGWDINVLEYRAEKNAEYPLGIDFILVTADTGSEPAVLCLPRTTTVIAER